MATLTYPHNLTNATTADASQVMANFNAIKTLEETTKHDPANLTAPNADCFLQVNYTGTIATGVTAKVLGRRKTPASVSTFTAVEAQVAVETVTGAVTMQADILVDGVTILSATLPNAVPVAGTLYFTTSFATAAIAASKVVVFVLTLTGGTSVGDVSIGLWGKTQHRS